MCVPTTLIQISLDEMRVLAWLREHKVEIIAAEAEFQVDRRAVAAAIAWEALENVRSFSIRAEGPGKEHVFRWSLRSISTDEGTWAKAVEDSGLLPVQPYSIRVKTLHSASGGIRYVAATMDLIAIIYEKHGSPGVCAPPIRLNPAILTNVYQGSDPERWTERVRTIKVGEVVKPGNPMALWYTIPRSQQLIEDGVGPTEVPAGQTAARCEYRDATPEESKRVLEKATVYKDAPYKWGGSSSAGIDCSHLIWKAINDALPNAKFQFADTAGIASSPGLRKLSGEETPVSGDVILFKGHVGLYDANPPTPGRTLFSAEGDVNKPTPGVTWGKPEWFTGPLTYLKVRVPCN